MKTVVNDSLEKNLIEFVFAKKKKKLTTSIWPSQGEMMKEIEHIRKQLEEFSKS